MEKLVTVSNARDVGEKHDTVAVSSRRIVSAVKFSVSTSIDL